MTRNVSEAIGALSICFCFFIAVSVGFISYIPLLSFIAFMFSYFLLVFGVRFVEKSFVGKAKDFQDLHPGYYYEVLGFAKLQKNIQDGDGSKKTTDFAILFNTVTQEVEFCEVTGKITESHKGFVAAIDKMTGERVVHI